MAYLVGFATKEEIAELQARGWDVEPAERYNLVGDIDDFLMSPPKSEDEQAVVVFVDNDLFGIMSGPDWDTSSETLFWSNTDGWVDFASSDFFVEPEKKTLNLPIDGEWFKCKSGWRIRQKKKGKSGG
jgi:hypothetical protein